MSTVGESLGLRDYRLFSTGAAAAATGAWMQSVAQSWLLYRLTNAPETLGRFVLLIHLPAVLLSPWAGALLDRADRRVVLRAVRVGFLLHSALLACLAGMGAVKPWHILTLAVAQGCLLALDLPGQQVLAGELVPEEGRLNALALKGLIDNLPRIFGPAMAGILVAAAGEWSCFAANAVGQSVFLAALLWLKRGPAIDPAPNEADTSLRQGLAAVWEDPPSRRALCWLGSVSLAVLPTFILAPVFARQVLGAGAQEAGWLSAAVGLGAALGSLYLAPRRETDSGLERLIARGAIAAGLALGAAAAARSLPWLLILFAGASAAAAAVMVSSNALLQSRAGPLLRGRAMGLFSSVIMGSSALGALLASAVASRLGAPASAALGGGLCLLAATLLSSGVPAAAPERTPA